MAVFQLDPNRMRKNKRKLGVREENMRFSRCKL